MQRLTSLSKFFVLFLSFQLYISAQIKNELSTNGMVVSAEKIASTVGCKILKEGGNAIDAAVATGFALAVTYPVAGNIGGGGFMVIHLNNGLNTTIDYREMAPTKADEKMFLDSAGNFLSNKSQIGALAGGIPGSVAGMIYALEKYGTLPLSKVIAPAIELAENGIVIDSSLAISLKNSLSDFLPFSSTMAIFSKHGKPFKVKDTLYQKDLAETLKRIRDLGVDGFYKGKTAEIIEKSLKEDGGIVTQEDLAKYKCIERAPLSSDYRGYTVISMPPPSSGGIALIQLLNILENIDVSKLNHNSSLYTHYLVEAMRRVYADRSEYLGDPDFYKVPVSDLLSKEYALKLFRQITEYATKSKEVKPGLEQHKESEQTTHYSTYDSAGNAVSVTTTINSGYGSKLVVKGAGFFWNNEMDDFSAKPGVPNQFGLLGGEANAIKPFKRMLSSMTPTIILKDNKPYLIVGSPGGSTIITVVLQTILNVLDFKMDLGTALNAKRFHHQWYPDEIQVEEKVFSGKTQKELIKLGYQIGKKRVLGLVEAILIDSKIKRINGVADPRGSGIAVGY